MRETSKNLPNLLHHQGPPVPSKELSLASRSGTLYLLSKLRTTFRKVTAWLTEPWLPSLESHLHQFATRGPADKEWTLLSP